MPGKPGYEFRPPCGVQATQATPCACGEHEPIRVKLSDGRLGVVVQSSVTYAPTGSYAGTAVVQLDEAGGEPDSGRVRVQDVRTLERL
jgi:hypothetical protein